MLFQLLAPLLVYIPLLIQATPAATPSESTPPSPTTTTGNFQEEDDVCTDYKTCGTRGLTYWNILFDTLRNRQSQDRTDGFGKFQQYYTAQYVDTKKADLDISPDLIVHGIDPDYLDVWTTVDKGPKTSVQDLFNPYINSFNTRDGIVIADNNFRYDDQAKKLEWSELMYHTWQAASSYADALHGIDDRHPKGGPISTLKCVFQHIVVNKQTQEVIKLLYQKMGYAIEQDIEWKKWTEEDQPNWFHALLGTDNVKGTVYFLNDHAQEIGRKEITEIWTRWDVFAPDIWYVLSLLDVFSREGKLRRVHGVIYPCGGIQNRIPRIAKLALRSVGSVGDFKVAKTLAEHGIDL